MQLFVLSAQFVQQLLQAGRELSFGAHVLLQPFANGVATNVGSDWHVAKAAGLPSRYITSIRMDPQDPRTVYATLAGYGRRWAFPG